MFLKSLAVILAAAVPAGCASAPEWAPNPENPSRIAMGSCIRSEKQPIWEHVLAYGPDVFLFLGDNVYADTFDMAEMQRFYDALGAREEVRRLRETSKVFAVWDDHDYGWNDAGREYSRKEESQAIFREFWKPQGNYGGDAGTYSLQQVGDVQFILLDTRYFRDRLTKPDGPGKTLLGEAQWAWLEEIFASRPARLRVIASSIQFAADEQEFEKWGWLFENERRRMIALLRKHDVEGVLFVSGDRHTGEISRADLGLGYPVYDLTASPMAQNPKTRERTNREPNRWRLGENFPYDNFGAIEVDWTQADPPIALKLYDEEGTLVRSTTLRLSELR
jgi:alkaline phosphatase D